MKTAPARPETTFSALNGYWAAALGLCLIGVAGLVLVQHADSSALHFYPLSILVGTGLLLLAFLYML